MTTTVRIYQPPKSAMQSGRANTRQWLLEYEPAVRQPQGHSPLMGWVSSVDTRRQVRLRFPTREAAVAFAERKGFAYTVENAAERRIVPKSYADNFRTDRPA